MLIAWTGLLSLFPLLLALLALAGFIVRDAEILAAAERAVTRLFPPEAAAAVVAVLTGSRESAGQLGLIGLAGLLLSGSALFGAMAEAFNTVYRVPSRGPIGRRLMAVAMLVILAVLLLLSVLANSVANLMLAVAQGMLPLPAPQWSLLISLASWALALASGFVLFLLIYRVVPNAGQRLAEVWPGALFAAVAFLLLQQLFPLYLRFFGGITSYAIFGLFFLVMIWCYLVAQVLVIGAELNVCLSRPFLGVEEPPAVAPSRCVPTWLAIVLVLVLTGWLIIRSGSAHPSASLQPD